MDIELAIGDISNAIQIIQDTQTDALKALAEFVENSIDASSAKCEIIRKKIKGNNILVIKDYGDGFPPDEKGVPDFQRVVTNICNSLKRRLSDRESIQGEFGIGILGFSSIGENLQIRSKGNSPTSSKMILKKGSMKASIDSCFDPDFEKGTEVTIYPINKSVIHKLSVERISKYLGEELAERIKSSNIIITVSDEQKNISRQVKPFSFEGRKLAGFDKILTKSGCNIHFDLYECSKERIGKIAVVRRGTKILDDISEIEEFNCEPWNKGVVEGKIDYRLLNVPPATRRGIIRDEAFEEFVESCRKIEEDLQKEVSLIEKRRTEKVDPKFVKKIKETFEKIMEELGDSYAWFGSKEKGKISPQVTTSPSGKKPLLISFGKLFEVKIRPSIVEIAPGESKILSARAYDEKGGIILGGINYYWKVRDNIISYNSNGSELIVSADDNHIDEDTEITVTARQENIEKEATARLIILENKPSKRGSGLNIIFENRGEELWRSQFDEKMRLIRVNSGHRDYKEIHKKGHSSVFRYVTSLVAKELAYYNHKGEGEDKVLESFVEILAAYERIVR
jgi:hypothetical protein